MSCLFQFEDMKLEVFAILFFLASAALVSRAEGRGNKTARRAGKCKWTEHCSTAESVQSRDDEFYVVQKR